MQELVSPSVVKASTTPLMATSGSTQINQKYLYFLQVCLIKKTPYYAFLKFCWY